MTLELPPRDAAVAEPRASRPCVLGARVVAAPRRCAVVLGATLALGGASLAGCDVGVEVDKIPSLASSTRPVAVDEPATGSSDPDIDAEEGRLATLSVGPGFVPDPLVREGTTAGGPIDASRIDASCEGWIAEQPDVVLDAPRPFAELTVMVASREDTTLVIVGPEGRPRCADDEAGSHPLIRADLAAGRHRVWVGTRSRGVEAPFVLAVSELDDSTPESLLH